jgi:hypothetical protein
MLTAGHCFVPDGQLLANGSSVNHAGGSIGTKSDDLYYNLSVADVMMIDVAQSRESNYVFKDGNPSQVITTPELHTVGSVVWRSGISSGSDPGLIQSSAETTSSNGRTFINQVRVSVSSIGGDSGAPMHNSYRAYGIFASGDPQSSWYGRIEFIEQHLGVVICIDLSCTY